jgi:hypothetical protein
MDKTLARFALWNAHNAVDRFNGLVRTVKQHGTAEDYESLSKAIAKINGRIANEIIAPLAAKFPDLKAELDATIAKYGYLI